MKHIQFFGEATECAKWLPFSKKKLDRLTRLYRGRRYWTWERVVGEVRISLERNGEIEYIRIYASIRGYEFSTVIDSDNPDDAGSIGRFTIAVAAIDRTQPDADPPVWVFKARNRRGKLLRPENAIKALDRKDRWLVGGRYGVPDDEEDDTDLGTYFLPHHDWFELSVPQNDEEAEAIQYGRRAGRILKWYTWRSRHYDLSLWTDLKGAVIYAPSNVFSISTGRKSRLTGLSVVNSDGGEFDIFPRAGGSCYQGPFLLAASWIGHDFMFEARRENYEEYFTGSSFFALSPPGWVSGDVRTHWYWRGDGKRCVSLQYGKTINEGPIDDDIDAGFVEAEIILDEDNGTDDAPSVESASFLHQQHNMGSLGIHPVAIDYDLLDQRKKRAFYFLSYIGPIRFRGTSEVVDGEVTTIVSHYDRDLLIYLVCADIESSFPGTEQWRIPVWHGAAWNGQDVEPDVAEPAEVSDFYTVLDGLWWSAFGYPVMTQTMMADDLPVHPYLDLRAVIVAMDARADAVALHYQVMLHDPHVVAPSFDVTESPHFGKYYRIWGEARQSDWIRPDLETAVDDPGPGLKPQYDWLPYDPGDPPDTPPEPPPGDFFNYLATVPSGYEPFIKGSTYDFQRVQTGLQSVQSTILQQMVYMSFGIGENSPYRNYNGFRISPTKSYAVIANNISFFYHVNTVFPPSIEVGESYYGVPHDWWVIDHIEKNRGVDEEGDELSKAVATHYDLYNESRGTSYTPGDLEGLASAAITGIWVE